MEQPRKTIYNIFLIAIVLLLILLGLQVLLEFPFFITNPDYNTMYRDILVRLVVGLVFIYQLIKFGYSDIFKLSLNKKLLLFAIPALIIAINNFPISAYVAGRYVIEESNLMYFMFGLESLSVGLFEEVVFRGLLLVVLIQVLPKSKQGNFFAIVLSAAIFGGIHFFNIAYGGWIGHILQQVGYSFLVGMMWALVFLKTRNVWVVVILHALYNYFGNIMFQMGTVTNRYDTFTIVITVIFSVLVFGYYMYEYVKMDVIEE